jgi:hypothetical protein
MAETAVVIPGRTLASVFDATSQVPALYSPDAPTAKRAFEFFAVNIRNPNTRKAYARAASEFANWCELHRIADVRSVQPVHVAAYIEGLTVAAPSIKQRLAALRMLFDWLVVGQVMPMNPASSVRGPRHSVKKGKTPVLTAEEARALLDAIDTSTLIGLRDRALIGLMVYTFARVGATIQMRVEDVYIQGRRTWVRLHEKGGKEHEMPCHHPEFDIRDRPPQALWGKKLHRDSNLPPFYLLSFEISVVARYERIVVSWVPPLSYTPAHVPQAHEVRRPPIRSARGVVSQRSRSATPTHHLHPGPA